jgi:hypothetical protein
MNATDVSLAIRQFRQRLHLPTLPRVKAGFRTLYLQCRPQEVVRHLPRPAL